MKSKALPFFSAFFGAVFGCLAAIVLLSYGILPAHLLPGLQKKELISQEPAVSVKTVKEEPSTEKKPPLPESSVYKEVIHLSLPSVVGITTASIKEDDLFGNIPIQEVGTGVIVDPNGYILTNSHVIRDGKASEVHVIFSDGEKSLAHVLWHEKMLDLAVIKVPKNDLPSAMLGDSDKVEVGDIAIAIGNPLGLQFERSVTQGIISGLNRRIEMENGASIEDLIQTDASINQGNSGGPLLNSAGEVIGINSAKIRSAEGLGFAIPINLARPIVDELIRHGDFRLVSLGISRTSWLSLEEYRLFTERDFVSGYDHGVFIGSIYPNSPAEIAGLREGDILVELDGEKLETNSKLVRILYRQRPGKTASLVWIREGQEYSGTVLFDEYRGEVF